MSDFPDDPVYYRIYLTREQKLSVVCMKSFDEYDYDENRFLRDVKTGERVKFAREFDALLFLNEHAVPAAICDDCVIANNSAFWRRSQ